MEIRKAVKKDFPQLRNLFLEAQKYEANFDKDIVVNKLTKKKINQLISEIFKDPDRKLFVAENKDNIVGYVWATFSPGMDKNGWISDIFVVESFRQKGIGSKLLMTALDWMEQRGAKAVKLVAYKADKKALSFYKKHKFEPELSKFINLIKQIGDSYKIRA